jgi:hypothetical protein
MGVEDTVNFLITGMPVGVTLANLTFGPAVLIATAFFVFKLLA